MTPEAQDYLDKAKDHLSEAQKIGAIGLAKAAARSAYYAAFHAAQALIVERAGKIAKTHSGVRSEFARLAKDEPRIDRTFPAFLAQAHLYKEVADYGTGAGADVSMSDANSAIASASRLIDCITARLG
jgi:uncharacterized protein (UPF0332 family)